MSGAEAVKHGPRLAVEDIRIASEFKAMLAQLGVPAPWTWGDDGSVFAANRTHVLVVDHERALPDDTVKAIAVGLVLAVNTCAGFRAVQA